jgi:hypothetical protein
MAKKLHNISILEFKSFLLFHGLKHIRTSGGHEVWSGKDLLRPVVFQTHIDPIPFFIIKNNLRTMNLTLKDLQDYFEKKN